MAKSLKLQAQRMGKPTIATDRPIAKILVKTGVFHLDTPFDYQIPESLSDQIAIGSRVAITFRGKKVEGFVVDRVSSTNSSAKLQIIERNLGVQFDREFLPLLAAWQSRWGANPLDILRFACPDPVMRAKPIQTQIKLENSNLPKSLLTKHARLYWQLPPLVDEATAAAELIKARLHHGRVLAIFPEERLLKRIEKLLIESEIFPAILSSDMGKSERYSNFLASIGDAELTMGTRQAAMSPGKYVTTIVWREDSEHHYEVHSPGWNSRDVSLIRSATQNSSLIFAGYVPSVEVERLIETGYATIVASAGKVRAFAVNAQMNEILPSPIFKRVKTALKNGPVLFLVPTKGYGQAISCDKCRNIAKCKCGGKLTKLSKTSPPNCTLCGNIYSQWRCSYCSNEIIRVLGRGIDRIYEEIGKTFPQVKIYTSTAERELSRRVLSNSIVLATPGMAANQFFKLTVILDGHNNFRDIRSDERYFNTLFRYGALAETEIDIVGNESGPEVSALIQWSSISLVRRLNRERREAGLPPFFRSVVISAKAGTERIISGFQTAIESGRLPSSIQLHNNSSDITMFAPLADMQKLTDFIYEFQKRRSMNGKDLIKYRVDPYTLG